MDTEYGYPKWVPVERWKEKMATLKKEGEQAAEEMQSQGRPFRESSPKRRPDSSEIRELNLVAVVIERDWKVQAIPRMQIIFSKAYNIGALAALSSILGRVIEENVSCTSTAGEFFFLYGRFEQKYRCSKSQQTRKKMKLINGKKEFMKTMAPVILPYRMQSGIS